MSVPKTTKHLNLLALMLAFAMVSACTPVVLTPSPSVGPTAGAPSAHTPLGYETSISTAATTSTLGGSAIIGAFSAVGPAGAVVTAVATTGSITHNTGRLELNDGTYLFIDTNGPDVGGNVTDGFATGSVGSGIFSTAFSGYDYVLPYSLDYFINGTNYINAGIAGMVTGAADMPIAGTASYTGTAVATFTHNSPADFVNDIYLDDGISTVDVNFASGSAAINLGNFARITDDMNNPITAAAAAFDQIRGTGLVISGSHIVGGTWVTLSGGSIVTLLGAGSTTGDGTFFGYDPSISAPDEVGGVVVFDSATATIVGLYIAD